MFKIIKEPQNDLDRLKLFNDKTHEYVSIVPGFGSNINELALNKGGNLYEIIDGNLDKASFDGMDIFKGANLLPFPNRLKGGKYIFRDVEYQLPRNYKREGNAAHGFIYNKSFDIVNKIINENEAKVTLQYDYDGQISGYPFPVKIKYTYKFSAENGFQCITEVQNCGESDIPFGCGWHPFFTFKKKVDQLRLKFSPAKQVILDSNLLPNGARKDFSLFDSFRPIDKDSFDSCFYLKKSSDRHITELYDPQADVTIQLWQETGPGKYNYLQIYTPPHRNSIAMEPMTCNVNSFNNGDGLIILKPRQSFRARYGIKLS